MKRIYALLLSALLLLGLAACTQKDVPTIEGTPEEIIEKIYAAHHEIDLALVGMEVDLQDTDALPYYTGLTSADKLSAAAVSETMLGQPYSLVVARVKNAADAASVAKQMYEGIDTRKWICVAADTKVAAYSGDVVMFFMIDSEYADAATTDSMLAAFRTVCGSATAIG